MKEFIVNLKKSWKYVRDQKAKLIKYALCNLVSIVISVALPIMSAQVIVQLTSNLFDQLLWTITILFLCESISYAVGYFAQYYSQVVYREGFSNLQTELGREILKIENQCLDTNSTGLFIQRLTGDTGEMINIYNILNRYLSNLITNIGILGAIYIIHPALFCYTLCSIVLLFIHAKFWTKRMNGIDRKYRKDNEKVSGFVSELVRGIRDIKMLHAEEGFIDELKTKVKQTNQRRYQLGTTTRRFHFSSNVLSSLYRFGLIFIMVFMIQKDWLAVAGALVVDNYSYRVTSVIHSLGLLLEGIKSFNLSSRRVFDLIESEEFTKEHFGPKHLDHIDGDFAFENVTFHYGSADHEVLKKINFKVHANETVAFVGKSGAGKTTIFNLLCKMYEPTSGKISIDGHDIRELDCETIRGNITIISQQPYIFNLSIRENLRLIKDDLTEEEMIEACKMACLDDFIMSLPDKYDTIIGEGGINLSGGERQRLAIARAFIQKTEIILFDEATSALDNETQARIQQAIEHLKQDYTILIIAHRLSTIIHSDRILFLNDGKIEMQGTHEELLKKSKAYRELYEAEWKENE